MWRSYEHRKERTLPCDIPAGNARREVSAKSIARDISEIRCFLAENRELTGHAELVYDRSAKCYTLRIDDFLRDSETLAVIKVLIGSRAFSKPELLEIIGKLRRFTSTRDKALLDSLISKEKYHYCEVRHDCSEGVVDMLWKLAAQLRAAALNYATTR